MADWFDNVIPRIGGSQASGTIPVLGNVPRGTLSRRSKEDYVAILEQAARDEGVDPKQILAFAEQESGFNPNAVSEAGAVGLGQLMPATAARFGVTDRYDPEQNARGTARYLRFLNERYPGDMDKVAAGYFAGEGAVDKYGGVPPHPKTQQYVKDMRARLGVAPATDDWISGIARRVASGETYTPPAPPQAGMGEFRKAFTGSLIGQNPEMFGNALKAIGVSTDTDWLRKQGDEIATFGADIARQYQAKVPSIENIHTFSDIIDYAASSAGSALGSAVPSLAVGAAAGMVSANPVVGVVAGAAGPSYLQNLGDVYGSVSADPDIQKSIKDGKVTEKQVSDASLLAAVPIAALDTLSLERILGKAFQPAKDALIKRIAKGIASGAITEGPTEGLQQVFSEWTQQYLGGKKTLAEQATSVIDNAIGGALGGAAVGGGARAIQRKQPESVLGRRTQPAGRVEPTIETTPEVTAPAATMQESATPEAPATEGFDLIKGKPLEPYADTLAQQGEERQAAINAAMPAPTGPSFQVNPILRRQTYPSGTLPATVGEPAPQAMPEAAIQPTLEEPSYATPVRSDQGQVRQGGEEGQPEIQPMPEQGGGNLQQQAPGQPGVEQVGIETPARSFEEEVAQYKAKKERNRATILEAGQGKAIGVELKHKNRDQWGVVLPDAQEPGKVRIQWYDQHGFSGHEVYNTEDDAVDELATRGFTVPDKGSMDRLEGTEEWNKGMEWAEKARQSWQPADKAEPKKQQVEPLDLTLAAHEAATSPRNALPEPTESQREAGNYQKGHLTLHGLDISIENPAGSKRRPEWPKLKNHYGYIKGTVGRDKDHIDTFLTDQAGNADLPVFVVDQIDPKTRNFDEHKVILGTADEEQARQTYQQNYSKNWKGLGAIKQFSLSEFKDWLKGDTTQPVSLKEPEVSYHDDRLKQDRYRKWLKQSAQQDFEPGGGIAIVPDINYKRGESDKRGDENIPTTVTPSVHAPWVQELLADTKMSVKEIRAAVDKAITGKRLGKRQQRAVSAILDNITASREQEAVLAKERLVQARTLRQQNKLEAAYGDVPGWLFEEPEYHPEMDGTGRTLHEWATHATKLGFGDQSEALLGSGRKDTEIARELAQLIAGAEHGRTGETGAGAVESKPVERPVAEAVAGGATRPAARPPVKEEGARPEEVTGERRKKKSPGRKAEHRTGEQRRRNWAMRKDIESMGPEEQKAAILELRRAVMVHKLTGLPDREAWQTVKKKPYIAAIDADSLGWINDNVGNKSGDELLVNIAKALKKHLGEDAYHISGDEFWAHGENKADLESALKAAQDDLSKVDLSAGNYGTLKGIQFSYGITQDEESADRAMKANKLEREASGLRAKKTQKPINLVTKEVEKSAPGKRPAVEELPRTQEHESLIKKYGLPDNSVFETGNAVLTKGKVRVGSSNWKATAEEAAKEYSENLEQRAQFEENAKVLKAANDLVADKLRRGENPTFGEWRNAFPQLKPGFTYLRQPEISPFLVEYFGFSKGNIKKPLGKAAGTLTSDFGATYPIVYINKLADVLGKTELSLTQQTESDIKAEEQRKKEAKKREQEEEAKAKADEAAKGFVLAGSEREADQAAARGQEDLLGEGNEPKPMYSRKAVEKPAFDQTKTEAFKRWSNNAPLITSKDAETHQFKTGEKVVVEAFHGTSRPDRVGTKFLKKRATSGPLPFHTSDPALASGYAQGKRDTSLDYEETDYANWFKFKPEGSRSFVDITRAWYHLDEATKAKIFENAPKLRLDDEREHVVSEEGNKSGNGSYDYNLEETQRGYDKRGNPLKALVEDWLNSGILYNDEELFLDVLKKSGFPVKQVTYDNPNASYPFVYKNYITMQNPLVTNNVPENVITALRDAAKRDRARPALGGADIWDKNTRTLREWVGEYLNQENTSTAYVWTSIPDKVTSVFESLGYDGIIDWSGKGGGNIVAPVYIPFRETQIKSAIGNKGRFDLGKKDILFSRKGQTETPAFRKWFGDSKVVDDNGVPLVVYRGLAKDVESFPGIVWVSESPELASEYAIVRGRIWGADEVVYPVYASIKNPVRFRHAEQRKSIYDVMSEAKAQSSIEASDMDTDRLKNITRTLEDKYGERVTTLFEFWKDSWDFIEYMSALGFDGIEVHEKSNMKSKTFGAFNPTQIKSAIGNRGTFNPDDANILHSRNLGTGSTVTAIEKRLSKPLATMRKQFPVNVVQSAADVPGNHPNDIRGVYQDGSVWIVADNIPVRESEITLAHEAVGHLGLETLLGQKAFNDLVKIVKQQKRLGDKRTLEIIKTLKQNYLDEKGNYALDDNQEAREVLAHIAEGRTRLVTGSVLAKLYERIKAAVRLWLSKHGFGDMENALIDSLIVRAARQVQGEFRGAGTPSGQVAYSRRAQEELAPVFYSQMQRVLADKLPKSGDAAQIKQAIDAYVRKGEIKPEEVEWSGVDELLSGMAGKKVSKDELLGYLKANEIQVTEKVLGGEDTFGPAWFIAYKDGPTMGTSFSTQEEAREEIESLFPGRDDLEVRQGVSDRSERQNAPTKFSTYQLPGGENYRELLLMLPVNFDQSFPTFEQWLEQEITPEFRNKENEGRNRRVYNLDKSRALAKREQAIETFRSGHYDEPNILAHVRFNERTDADGKRVLFIEEVQSDWHQKGRKEGYKNPKRYEELNNKYRGGRATQEEIDEMNRLQEAQASGVPDAPFKTTWPLLAMKRMIRYAAENGFDRIAWTTGDQQIDRYWGSQTVSEAVDRFKEVAKPQSVRKLAEDIFGGKMASLMPLNVVDGGVLTALKNDKIKRIVIESIPVDVMNILRDENISTNDLFGNDDVVASRLSIDGRRRTADAILSASRLTATAIRTKLGSLTPASGDIELAPTIRASDLSSREVAGLLSPQSIFHLGPGAGPKEGASTGSRTESLLGGERGILDGKLAPAKLAELLNAHVVAKYGREGLLTQGFESPPGIGMRGFYDQILTKEVGKYVKKWGAKVGTTKVDTIPGGPREMGDVLDRQENPDFRMAKAHSLDITPSMRESALQGQPLYSRRGGQQPGYLNRLVDSLIYNYQDRMTDLKRLQRETPAESEEADAVLAEERYAGMVAAKIEDFHQDYRDPLIKAIHDAGLEYEQVERYLDAKDAPYRNAAMKAINPTQEEIDARVTELQDTLDGLREDESVKRYIDVRGRLSKGKADVEMGIADASLIDVLNADLRRLSSIESVKEFSDTNKMLSAMNRMVPYTGDNTALSGTSNAEAKQIIKDAKDNGTFDALEGISKMIDAITAKTRQTWVDGGLQTQDIVDVLEEKYPHYIPRQREEVGGDNPIVGQGYNVKGNEFKRATGSTRRVENILANLMAQHEAAIIRSEKNKVDVALFNFAKQNPEPSLWSVDNPDRISVIDPVTNTVKSMVDPLYKQRDNVLTLKIDGQEHTIEFNERDPNMVRLAYALKNLSSRDLGEVTQLVGRLTRFLANVNTSANPVFLARNFLRDLQTAWINLSSTELANVKGKVMRGVLPSIRAMWQMERGNTTNRGAQYAREFRDAGGMTGWMEHYKDIESRADSLKKQLDAMKPGAWNMTKRMANDYWQLIVRANSAVENGVRLSIYRTAREQGLSIGRAASIAKNTTINFNRRGAKGVELNMWYMFANASIQGTQNIVSRVGSPAVRRILMVLVASGFLLDMLNRALAGDDDDDGKNDYDQLPEYTKANNFVIWINGRPWTFPQAYGFNFFTSIGRKASEMMFRNDTTPAKAAMELAGVFMGAFSPVGSSGSLTQFVSPTLTDPLIQWAENKNFAGNPMYKEQIPFGPPMPEYQMGFKSTSAPAKWITQVLNDATGGSEVRPGAVNINPALLDHAVSSLLGGMGRTYLQAFSTPIKLVEGEEITSREIPFYNIFAGSKPEYQTESNFYDNLRAVETTQRELKFYASDPERVKKIREANARDIRMLPKMKFISAQLRQLRKNEKVIDKNNPKDAKERLAFIEKRKRELMSQFNKAYYQGAAQ